MNSNRTQSVVRRRRNLRQRKKGKRVRNNERPSGGLEYPYPTSKPITVINTTDGSAQAAAAGYCLLECPLSDPTLAVFAGGTGAFSTAITGISDMAAYSLARVKSTTIEVSGCSLETTTILTIVVVFSDVRLSTIPINTYLLAKACQIGYLHTKPRKIAVSTGNSAFNLQAITLTPKKVVGDKMVYNDRDFITTVNPAHVAPNQEHWCTIIVTSPSGTIFITNGLDLSITVTQKVHAFSRLPGF